MWCAAPAAADAHALEALLLQLHAVLTTACHERLCLGVQDDENYLGEDVWKVEAVRAKRKMDGKIEYLLKWEGYARCNYLQPHLQPARSPPLCWVACASPLASPLLGCLFSLLQLLNGCLV